MEPGNQQNRGGAAEKRPDGNQFLLAGCVLGVIILYPGAHSKSAAEMARESGCFRCGSRKPPYTPGPNRQEPKVPTQYVKAL